MTITEIRITLDGKNGGSGGLVGTAEVVFDRELAVKEIKIIRDSRRAADGTDLYFLEFPQRPFVQPCPDCRGNNPLQARYCARCGTSLESQEPRNIGTAHPVASNFRAYVTDAVLEAYVAKKG